MKAILWTIACFFLISASTSLGGINLVSGPGTLVLNPVSMFYTADAYGTNTVFYWAERTNHLLTSDLVVSILPPLTFPGFSTAHSNDNSLTVATGTLVDSYYIHFDPVGGSTVATFSFDAPILGLITNDLAVNDHFLFSDFLIDPLVPAGNIPFAHFDNRGIEPSINSDFIRWLNPFTIQVHLDASSPGDQIRILTSFTPTPEPTAILAVCIAMIGTAKFARIARRVSA